jgi:hypothetical protein
MFARSTTTLFSHERTFTKSEQVISGQSLSGGKDLGQALTTNIDPGFIVFTTGTGAVIGSGIGIGIAAADAVTGGGVVCALTALCRDRVVGEAEELIPSIWEKAFGNKIRGDVLEGGLGINTPGNYPVVDRWKDRIATSIKSVDLIAATYQNVNKLTSHVRGLINQLINFQGRTWAGYTINAADIVGREFDLAIPPGASEEQLAALKALQDWAATQGVSVIIETVK